jgi:hypothetical protein
MYIIYVPTTSGSHRIAVSTTSSSLSHSPHLPMELPYHTRHSTSVALSPTSTDEGNHHTHSFVV